MNDLSISGLDAGYGGQPIISGFSLPPLTAGEVVSVVGIRLLRATIFAVRTTTGGFEK